MKALPLIEFYESLGANISTFAGWQVPLWFEGVIPEHLAVRESVGIFDVSHMGRFWVRGSHAAAMLDYLFTHNIATMPVGAARYSLCLNEGGGIKDDLIVYRVDENSFFVVCNAVNREKIYGWLTQHASSYGVSVEDVTERSVMFAIQGPNSPPLIEKTLQIPIGEVKWFRFTTIKRDEATLIVARTGYTGEDGFEVIILPEETVDLVDHSTELLQQLLSSGRDYNVKLCGFGARDSLRLEAGLVLYDHEISEDITPLEARLHLFVKFEKESFIGKEPLEKQDLEGLSRVRVGLLMIDPGIPREGYSIVKGERIVGKVTSGGYSPLLKKGIAMALVDTRHAILDSCVYVKIRQRNAKAKIVNWPFYNTAQYGRTRVVKWGARNGCKSGRLQHSIKLEVHEDP